MGKYIYNDELNPISYINNIPFRFLNYRGNAGNFRIGNSRQLVFIPKKYINEDKTLKINELNWFVNKPTIKHKIELYLEEGRNKNMKKERFMKNSVFSLEYDKETLKDLCLELQEQVKKQQEVIDKVIKYVEDYTSGERIITYEQYKSELLEILKEVSNE